MRYLLSIHDVWPGNFPLVESHVRRLREKLGTEADWIETIRGVGYRFAERRSVESANT